MVEQRSTRAKDSSVKFSRWSDKRSTIQSELLRTETTVTRPGGRAKRYELGQLLGEGGFGTVYECHAKSDPAHPLAIKFTVNHRAWAQELYFDSLVRNTQFGLKLQDSFALPDDSIRDGVLFCTVMDRAESDLAYSLYLRKRSFSEKKAIVAACQVLEPLVPMHNSGVVHRDVTPWNVFVMADGTLRLADFGIAAQATDLRLVSATTFNPGWVPHDLNPSGNWTPSLDCWQVGQLIAAMIRGTANSTIRQSDVRLLPCSDPLKETIWRAIGSGSERYGNASEFIQALKDRTPVRDAVATAKPSTLRGRKVCFTGKLETLDRTTAEAAARKAGAAVVSAVSFDTDYLILGAPSPAYATGSSGKKLLDAKRLNDQGARIRTVSETSFLRLAPPPRGRR